MKFAFGCETNDLNEIKWGIERDAFIYTVHTGITDDIDCAIFELFNEPYDWNTDTNHRIFYFILFNFR